MNTDDRNNQKEEQLVRQILAEARSQTQFSSPYLETRVLAHLREQRAHAKAHGFWKSFSLSAAGLSLALLAWIGVQHLKPAGQHEAARMAALSAQVDQAVVVKVEVKDIRQLAIARAEIELPEGVEFYSKAYPDLKQDRKITVAWHSGQDKTHFPFAIRATQSGERAVKVSFYNEAGELLHTKTLMIRFEQGRAS